MVAFEAKADDPCLSEENVPRGLSRVCCMNRGEEDSSPVFQVPICSGVTGQPEDPLCGRHISRGLLGIWHGRGIQEGHR